MPRPSRAPIAVALVDDYDVVVMGVANMLEPYRDRSPYRRTRLRDGSVRMATSPRRCPHANWSRL